MASTTKLQTDIIKVSLTSFADYLLKTGLTKLNAVRRVVEQIEQGYRPSRDYYRKFRDGIRDLHMREKPISLLEHLVGSVTDANKQVNYEALARGYRRFWGATFQDEVPSWVTPVRTHWSFEDVTVSINPELGFRTSTETYQIKLYLKEDKPSKQQCATILHLMQLMVRPHAPGAVVALLDVRRGKLIEPVSFNRSLTTVLEGEALCFQRMFRSIVRERSNEALRSEE